MAKAAALTKQVSAGNWGRVLAVISKSFGGCLAEKFLNSLSASDQAKCFAVFDQMASYGPEQVNKKRFKSEMDGLCAFKFEIDKRQIRFPCFRDGNCWIITHGFFKPGAQQGLGDWPNEHIDRAKNIRDEYIQRKSKAST